MTKETRVPKAKSRLRASSDTSRMAAGLLPWPASISGMTAARCPERERESDLLQAVDAAIVARTLRPDHVPSELLLDPAWDMLLELLRAEISGERANASTLAKAAGVSTSAVLRWIDALVAKGLCVRGDRADDGRMTVDLSRRGSDALRAYFAQIMRPKMP